MHRNFAKILVKIVALGALVLTPTLYLLPRPAQDELYAVYPQLKEPDFVGKTGMIVDPLIRNKAAGSSLETQYDEALSALLSSQRKLRTEERSPEDSRRMVVAEQSVLGVRTVRETAVPEAGPKAAGFDGLQIQQNTILVLFRSGTPVSKIRELLDRHDLAPRANLRDIPLFVVEGRRDTAGSDADEATRLRAIIDALKQERLVVTAVQNAFLSATTIPTVNAPIAGHCWDFNASTCEGVKPFQKMSFPEAWNFSDAIKRRNVRVAVGVLDKGFDIGHEDLAIRRHPGCGTAVDQHGNAVAGIIAARFGNAVGIDGGSPFADIVACAPKEQLLVLAEGMTTADALVDLRRQSFASVIDGLQTLLDDNLRLVNVSLGYNWRRVNLQPDTNPLIQEVVAAQGEIVRTLLRAHPNAIVVSSAGNDCGAMTPCNRSARWTSPINWAVLGGPTPAGLAVPNVVVVEATNLAGARLALSNTEGTIAAVGENLMTAFAKPSGYDLCPASTSCAAPAVTATIALMLAYNPNLSVAQIKTNLGITATGPRPNLNAFQAVKASQPNANADLANLFLDPGTIVRIDMRDFAQFKAAFRQVRSPGPVLIDLNGDGRKDAGDVHFCRADLNGDGSVTASDLEVMIAAWADPSVNPATLRTLLTQ